MGWNWLLTIGDLDGDGFMDFIGTGSTYTAGAFNDNEPPNWIDIVEYNGGDPEEDFFLRSDLGLDW